MTVIGGERHNLFVTSVDSDLWVKQTTPAFILEHLLSQNLAGDGDLRILVLLENECSLSGGDTQTHTCGFKINSNQWPTWLNFHYLIFVNMMKTAHGLFSLISDAAGGCLPGRGCTHNLLLPCLHPLPLWTEWDACENITFLQLLLWTVTIVSTTCHNCH